MKWWFLWLCALPLFSESYWKSEGEWDGKGFDLVSSLSLRREDQAHYLRFKPYPVDGESLCLALEWEDCFRWGPLSSQGVYGAARQGYAWTVFRDRTAQLLNRDGRNFINQGAVILQGPMELWMQEKNGNRRCGVQWTDPLFAAAAEYGENSGTAPAEQPWKSYDDPPPADIFHVYVREIPEAAGLSLAGAASLGPAVRPGGSLLIRGRWVWGDLTLEELTQWSLKEYRDGGGDPWEYPLTAALDWEWKGRFLIRGGGGCCWNGADVKPAEGEWDIRSEGGGTGPAGWMIRSEGPLLSGGTPGWKEGELRIQLSPGRMELDAGYALERKGEGTADVKMRGSDSRWILSCGVLCQPRFRWDYVQAELRLDSWELRYRRERENHSFCLVSRW